MSCEVRGVACLSVMSARAKSHRVRMSDLKTEVFQRQQQVMAGPEFALGIAVWELPPVLGMHPTEALDGIMAMAAARAILAGRISMSQKDCRARGARSLHLS